jgi:hypothetical protein
MLGEHLTRGLDHPLAVALRVGPQAASVRILSARGRRLVVVPVLRHADSLRYVE